MSTKKFVRLAFVFIIVALSVCEPLVTAAHAQNLRLRVERIQAPPASSTSLSGSMLWSQMRWQTDPIKNTISTDIPSTLESPAVIELEPVKPWHGLKEDVNTWSGINVRR